jgi:hypothetical protein
LKTYKTLKSKTLSSSKEQEASFIYRAALLLYFTFVCMQLN